MGQRHCLYADTPHYAFLVFVAFCVFFVCECVIFEGLGLVFVCVCVYLVFFFSFHVSLQFVMVLVPCTMVHWWNIFQQESYITLLLHWDWWYKKWQRKNGDKQHVGQKWRKIKWTSLKEMFYTLLLYCCVSTVNECISRVRTRNRISGVFVPMSFCGFFWCFFF